MEYLKSMEKLIEVFQKKARTSGYSLFLMPEIEKMEDISELKNGVVFFVDRNGDLLRLRGDYTKSIINYLKRNSLSEGMFWYEGFVYKYSTSNSITSQFQLGIEKIPFRSIEDGVNTIRIITESYLEVFNNALLIEIGDSRVIERLISRIPKDKRKELLRIVDTKNTAELEVFGKLNNLNVTQLMQIIYDSFEKRSIDDLNGFDVPEKVKDDIKRLFELMPNYKNVELEIDFSIARTVEEYDGLTFTIYDLSSSSLIAAGGRYKIKNGLYGVGGTIFLEEKSWLI